MRRKSVNSEFDDDALEVQNAEIEDLENDEISPEEAAFMMGYEEDSFTDELFEEEEAY